MKNGWTRHHRNILEEMIEEIEDPQHMESEFKVGIDGDAMSQVTHHLRQAIRLLLAAEQ